MVRKCSDDLKFISKLINIDQTSSKKNGFGSFGRERAVLVFGFQCLEQIIQKPDPRKTVREGSILVRLKYGDTNEDMMSNHKIQGYPVDPICSRKPFLVVFFYIILLILWESNMACRKATQLVGLFSPFQCRFRSGISQRPEMFDYERVIPWRTMKITSNNHVYYSPPMTIDHHYILAIIWTTHNHSILIILF